MPYTRAFSQPSLYTSATNSFQSLRSFIFISPWQFDVIKGPSTRNILVHLSSGVIHRLHRPKKLDDKQFVIICTRRGPSIKIKKKQHFYNYYIYYYIYNFTHISNFPKSMSRAPPFRYHPFRAFSNSHRTPNCDAYIYYIRIILHTRYTRGV